ncbi:MAG: hypothetical protein HYY06_10635 [Deltaproteobacteria bacterium]|nr:hypothetical protein [Deltaproteobacteria bacterium]
MKGPSTVSTCSGTATARLAAASETSSMGAALIHRSRGALDSNCQGGAVPE